MENSRGEGGLAILEFGGQGEDKHFGISEGKGGLKKSGPNCIFPLNTGFRFDQQMFLGLCKYFCRATHNMNVQII